MQRVEGSPFSKTHQHAAKREAILSEAALLFNARGARATTLKDISERLGLTKTSLYYYVRTKEDLIFQCYLATLDRIHATLDAVERDVADPLARTMAFCRAQFEQWSAAQCGNDRHVAALLEIAALGAANKAVIEQRYTEMFLRLRGYLQAGIEQGLIRNVHTTSATRAMIGSMDWLFHWLREVPRDSITDAARQTESILRQGLRGAEGEYRPGAAGPCEDPGQFHEEFDQDLQNRLKEQAFLRAGTRFFNMKGFDATSLDEIAEHLNVSKGAFYYRMRSKEDLLYQCYEHSIETLARIYGRADAAETSGISKLALAVREVFRVQNSDEGPLIRYNTITALPVARRRAILARTDRTNAILTRFLRDGRADGTLRDVDEVVARNLLSGAVNASMDIARWRRVDDLEQAAWDYFDIFLNGLEAKPRNTRP